MFKIFFFPQLVGFLKMYLLQFMDQAIFSSDF